MKNTMKKKKKHMIKNMRIHKKNMENSARKKNEEKHTEKHAKKKKKKHDKQTWKNNEEKHLKEILEKIYEETMFKHFADRCFDMVKQTSIPECVILYLGKKQNGNDQDSKWIFQRQCRIMNSKISPKNVD